MPRERTDSLPLWRARELLEAKRARLVERLGQDWQQAYDVADRPPLDEGERSSHEQLASVAHGRSTSELHQLRDIDDALSRIQTGDYGVCQNCEEPIDPARLEAIPEAELCIACAEEEAREHSMRRSPELGVRAPVGSRRDAERDRFGSHALDEATQTTAPGEGDEGDEEPPEESAVHTEPDFEERPGR